MAFKRYEVWLEGDDQPIDKLWGPAPSLVRAREVAQARANATGEQALSEGQSVRIDEIWYEYVGDIYPQYEYFECFDPPERAESE